MLNIADVADLFALLESFGGVQFGVDDVALGVLLPHDIERVRIGCSHMRALAVDVARGSLQ